MEWINKWYLISFPQWFASYQFISSKVLLVARQYENELNPVFVCFLTFYLPPFLYIQDHLFFFCLHSCHLILFDQKFFFLESIRWNRLFDQVFFFHMFISLKSYLIRSSFHKQSVESSIKTHSFNWKLLVIHIKFHLAN